MSLKQAKLEAWIVDGILIFLSIFLLYAAFTARENAARAIFLILGIPCVALTVNVYLHRASLYHSQALLHLKEGKVKEGFASLNLAVKLDPKHRDSYFLRGIWSHELGNFAAAIEDLNRAIQFSHKDDQKSEAFYSRGLCYVSQKSSNLALADFNSAIRLNENYEPAYFQRGRLHYLEHRLQEAIEDLSESIKFCSGRAIAYEYRGSALLLQGHLKAALTDFSYYIRLNPESFSGYYNSAVVLYSLARFQESLENFKKSATTNSTYCANYYGSSNVYTHLDNPDAALIDFEQAKILEADHPMESTDQHGFFHAGLAFLVVLNGTC